MKETSAKGTRGFLLSSIDDEGNPYYFFRVYKRGFTGEDGYTDYEIAHSDLQVEIVDDHASFVEYDDGRKTLDHDFRTLGRAPRTDKPTREQLKAYQKSLAGLTLVTYDKSGNRTSKQIGKKYTLKQVAEMTRRANRPRAERRKTKRRGTSK